jgi:hypothetical protein
MNMKRLLKFAAATLLGMSLNAQAANLDVTFTNDFGSLSNPVNEIFLWMDPGAATLSIRGFAGSMRSWTSQTVVPSQAFRLSGLDVTAPSTGSFTARFNFSGPVRNAPSFSFQWAEVFFDGTLRHVAGSGSLSYSGSASGTYTPSAAFTHLNSTDIPNLAPVPLPSSVVLLLSTLVFAPLAKIERRKQVS